MPSCACNENPRVLPSSPTRRSSDLYHLIAGNINLQPVMRIANIARVARLGLPDRKSTRLNFSHLGISYAILCVQREPQSLTLFPYPTLFRSLPPDRRQYQPPAGNAHRQHCAGRQAWLARSEEHTSELQSLRHLVCHLVRATRTPESYPLPLPDALPISTT